MAEPMRPPRSPIGVARRLVLSATACWGPYCGSAAAAAPDCGTVIVPTGLGVSMPAPPASLNPLLSNSLYLIEVMGQVLRQLAWFRPDGTADWDKGVAAAIDTPDDGSHFVVTLHDWRWSDGTPITADDLLFTLSLIRELGPSYVNWGSGGMPALIASARALDVRRVELTMTRKVNPDWFVSLALGNGFFVLPKHVFAGLSPIELRRRQNDPALFAVGDGPFRIADYALGRHIVLEPNPYWGGARPQVRRLVVSFPNGNAALEQLRTGQLDAATVPFLLTGFASRLPGFHPVPREPDTAYNDGVINYASLRAPFLRDLPVRRAITRAIDQKEIVSLVYRGAGVIGHGPVPPAMRSYLSPAARASYPDLSFDPADASRLLDAAGWRVSSQDGIRSRNGTRLAFEVMVSAEAGSTVLMAEILQRQLARVGIELSLRTMSFNQLYATMMGNGHEWDMAILGWSVIGYPDLHDFFATDGTQNFGHYRDPNMDRLAEGEMFGSGNAPLFAAQDYAAENVLALYLPTGTFPVLARNGLGGMDGTLTANDLWATERITLSGPLACPAAAKEADHS
ncbi:MAG: peptide ABC transporter substrate-binding protein [Gluconacetobacter diazotrophicus]|nr:peptide ABC transporter substrate-binding protein [Gluconacetobacter diazotrophicus]